MTQKINVANKNFSLLWFIQKPTLSAALGGMADLFIKEIWMGRRIKTLRHMEYKRQTLRRE